MTQPSDPVLQWWFAAPPPLPWVRQVLAQAPYVQEPYVVWSIYPETPQFCRNPKEWWPPLVPAAEYADFSYDAINDIPPGDSIVGLSISVAPAGEVVPSRLQLTPPGLVTVWLTGGVPGRIYTYELILTTQQIRALPIIIGQKCSQLLPQMPLAPPAYPNFGSTVTWPLPE